MFKNYIDISPLINESTAVFPGDVKYKKNLGMSFESGSNLNLSSISTTLHIGAHTDAPNHYHPEGSGISDRSLEIYMGHCQVITVHLSRNAIINPSDINTEIKSERVLFRTRSYPDPHVFNMDFNSLSPELIHFLKDKGVKLVGIDTPSVDPATSKELLAHKAIYESDMGILEGIVLDTVQDGEYQLIALPLKLESADASPVRAILIKGE